MDENAECCPQNATADVTGAVTGLSAAYADSFPLRAAVQAIPLLGGALDTIMGGLGEKWQRERVQSFIQMITARLEVLERRGFLALPPSEELHDYMLSMFEHARRQHSEQKREYLANLVARQVTTPLDWDLAGIFPGLVASLSDLHLQVLSAAATAPVVAGDGGLAGLRVVSLDKVIDSVSRLEELLPDYPPSDLLFVTADLVGRGLLHDEGIGRVGSGALEVLQCTDAGHQLLKWISGPTETSMA